MINKRNIAVISAIVFLAASTALAADFKAPQKDGDPNLTLSATESYHNLYSAGASLNMNSKISGDLFAAGGMVNVIGDVEEDVNLGGGTLSLSGKVGGDVRLAGGNITVSSAIGGDLLVGGGNVSITEKSSVGGDLVIGGGNIVLDAPVKGSIRVGAGSLTINSKVEGDVNVMISGGRNSGGLVFGPKAEVLGRVFYKGPKEAIISEGAKVSNINYTPYTGRGKAGRQFVGLLTLAFLVKLVAWFVAGWVIIHYRKNTLYKIVANIREKALENFGIGLAGSIVGPILAVALLFTLVGYYLAGLVILFYLLLLALSGLVGAIFLGSWLMKLISKSPDFVFDWKTLLLGVIVLGILKLIPILGWLVCAVVFLIAFGALLRLSKQKLLEDN